MTVSKIEEFRDKVLEAVPEAKVRLDQPRHKSGFWFLDAAVNGVAFTVEWRPTRGFGICTSLHKEAAFTGPDEVYEELDEAVKKVVGLLKGTEPYRAHPDDEIVKMLEYTDDEYEPDPDGASELMIERGYGKCWSCGYWVDEHEMNEQTGKPCDGCCEEVNPFDSHCGWL